MSEKSDFIDFLITDLLTGSDPPPTWQIAAGVLLIVLILLAWEYGLARLLDWIIGAIKTRWRDPPDRS